MIQGGGFVYEDGLKEKKAPRTILGEFATNGVKNDLHHAPGVISMARTIIPDSASSQFFICVDDQAYLDAQYAAFGRVTDEESLQVAIDISNVMLSVGGKATRVGFEIKDGKKVRVAKATGAVID
jgi:peptidyl-prolyl cis-trans isomerase B (cyclophilin B)